MSDTTNIKQPSTVVQNIVTELCTEKVPEKSILETYIEEVKVDTKLDEFTVKDVQMKLPAIKHKWVGRLLRTKAALHRLEREKIEIKKTLVKKLQHQSPVSLSLPAADKAVDGHEKVIEIANKIHEHTLAIEFLEKVERIFHSMTYDIKNLVDILKLEQL